MVLGPLYISQAGKTVDRQSDRTFCRSRNTWLLLLENWQWRAPSLVPTCCLRHHDSQMSTTASCALIQRCFRTQKSMAEECRSLRFKRDVGIGRSTDSQHRLYYRMLRRTGLLSDHNPQYLAVRRTATLSARTSSFCQKRSVRCKKKG
jgi:hypothetical protein